MRRVAIFLMVAVFFLALANPSPGASRDLPILFPIKQQQVRVADRRIGQRTLRDFCPFELMDRLTEV